MSLVTKISPIETLDSLSMSNFNLHDCLTDDADWNDEYWSFNQNCINNFNQLLLKTYEESTKGIKLQAIWAGDSVKIHIEVTINELIQTFETNKLSTSAEYIVNKSA